MSAEPSNRNVAADVIALDVTLMGRTFKVTCAPDEEADLRAAADYVDKKTAEIRRVAKVVDNERVAVMAALNIGHELLQARRGKGVLDAGEFRRRISAMRTTISEALAEQQDKLF